MHVAFQKLDLHPDAYIFNARERYRRFEDEMLHPRSVVDYQFFGEKGRNVEPLHVNQSKLHDDGLH